MSDPVDSSAEPEEGPSDSPLPWNDRTRIYRAIHTRQGRILHVCFIPNTGTHNRYLPLADLRLADASKDGKQLILEFSAVSVIVSGRFLSRAADYIAINRCAALEAYDEKRRDPPDDPITPFIDSISFVVPRQKPRTGPEDRPGAAKESGAG